MNSRNTSNRCKCALAAASDEASQTTQAIAWCDRYADLGGTDSMNGLLRGQSYYLAGEFGGAAKVLNVEVNRATPTGRKPPEIMLKLLANSSAKT